MTIYDLVGCPFPKNAPLFVSDTKLQGKLRQVESLIELHHDVQEIREYIATASKLQEDILQCTHGAISGHMVRDALAVAAVILYGKLFNSSQGRTSLNKMDVFQGTSDHDAFIDVRDKFLAHQEWNANRHQLFFFQKSDTAPLRMNPFGQTIRIPIWPNLDWGKFNACVEQVSTFLESRINALCNAIIDSLNPDQVEFLNATTREELFQEHWEEQPGLRKDPFSPRFEP